MTWWRWQIYCDHGRDLGQNQREGSPEVKPHWFSHMRCHIKAWNQLSNMHYVQMSVRGPNQWKIVECYHAQNLRHFCQLWPLAHIWQKCPWILQCILDKSPVNVESLLLTHHTMHRHFICQAPNIENQSDHGTNFRNQKDYPWNNLSVKIQITNDCKLKLNNFNI